MSSAGLVAALAIAAGSACALATDRAAMPGWALVALAVAAWVLWCARRDATVLLAVGFCCAAGTLGVAARRDALDTPLRAVLDRAYGGFDQRTIGPGGTHDPIRVRAVLLEDAARAGGFVSLRALVTDLRLEDRWQPARGGAMVAVAGTAAPARIADWRAGRTVEMFATFRRPARYLNDGVADFERQLALDGTTLFGSVKSGWLVEVHAPGGLMDEAAAAAREEARRRVERRVAGHDPVSAAIVTAVLIGDRTGLPDPIRLRLQAAGTYHIIAISGGNIAILAALALGLLAVCGIGGRAAALVTIVVLAAYAGIVSGGASVWRATLMAVVYLGARLADHRSPPWQAMAVAAAVVLCLRPLDVRDAAFLLTFGATAALLEAARRIAGRPPRRRVVAWLLASFAASTAVELALLPVNASIFSRLTGAGLALNLVAVPLMGLVQACGLAVVLLDGIDAAAAPAGWAAHLAAAAIVESARLVDVAPWLVVRVPPPPAPLVVAYYAVLAATLLGRGRVRIAAAAAVLATALAIITGGPVSWPDGKQGIPALRMVAFDVGQGDATLLQFPDRSTLLVDAGGFPFGGGGFDIGGRVLAPALWARGVRRLDALLLTHGDPDHIGGAAAVLARFAPARLWQGLTVPDHAALASVLDDARARGARVEQRQAGEAMRVGGAVVRVLHPPAADWPRRRVRNDDSVVLEVRYGDAAMLLLGDVGAGVERTLVDRLTPARIRILKVAHHGSRSSTSRELVERWRPQIAVISAGRGNPFGHPAPDVLARLESAGAAIYRTDRDGQITIDTDGQQAQVRTFIGGQDEPRRSRRSP